MLWDPLHFLESCPSSDGAAAVVLASEEVARRSAAPAGVGRRPRQAHGVQLVPGSRHGAPPVAGVDCAEALYAQGRGHGPVAPDRLRRALRPVLVVRADVARGPPHHPRRRGLEADRRGGDGAGRGLSREPVGRCAVVEPDRRVRPDPLPGGGEPGAGHSRGLPGRRARVALGHAYGGARAVLRDVDRELRSESGLPMTRRDDLRRVDQAIAASHASRRAVKGRDSDRNDPGSTSPNPRSRSSPRCGVPGTCAPPRSAG